MAEEPEKGTTIEAEEAELGAAKRPERPDALVSALAADMMQPHDLEARQERIGRKRRSGGPPLDEGTRESAAAMS